MLRPLMALVACAVAAPLVALATPTPVDAAPLCSTTDLPFDDVATDDWARADIACIHDLGITEGKNPTTYAPDDPVTRREMAAFIARTAAVLELDCDRDATTPFVDVPGNDWAREDIACIRDLGVTTGTSATTYSPDDAVTRLQMAAFLARTWAATGEDCPVWSSPFADVTRSSYGFEPVACLWRLEITTGTSASTYSPTDVVTRRQMAAFIARLLRAEPLPPQTPSVDELLEGVGFTAPEDVAFRLHLSVVGERPDGPGNPDELCADGVLQVMEDDPYCGYVDVGCHCVELINHYRSLHGLEPYVRMPERDACTAREARLAAEQGRSHYNDGCGWRAQASAGGGRGGDDSSGTVERSVDWLPYLIYREGPSGGHYQGMMREEVRGVSCSYYAIDRDTHRTFINYYDLPDE